MTAGKSMEEDNEDGVKATAEMRCEGSPNLYRWEMGDGRCDDRTLPAKNS